MTLQLDKVQARRAMQPSSGSAERPADDSTDSSDSSVEWFFQYLPASELTGREVDLLNSLISVSESLQAALPRSVSIQEWAARRVPKDCPGLPHIYRSQPKSARSAVQPASDSTAALLASAIPNSGYRPRIRFRMFVDWVLGSPSLFDLVMSPFGWPYVLFNLS